MYKTCKEAGKDNQKPRKRTSNRNRLINGSDVEVSKEHFKVAIINMLKKVENNIGKVNEGTENVNKTLESMKKYKIYIIDF